MDLPLARPKRFPDEERLGSQREPKGQEMVDELSDQSGPRCFGSGTYEALANAAACTVRPESPRALGRTGLAQGHDIRSQACFFIQESNCAISLVWSLTILRAIALSSGDFLCAISGLAISSAC